MPAILLISNIASNIAESAILLAILLSMCQQCCQLYFWFINIHQYCQHYCWPEILLATLIVILLAILLIQQYCRQHCLKYPSRSYMVGKSKHNQWFTIFIYILYWYFLLTGCFALTCTSFPAAIQNKDWDCRSCTIISLATLNVPLFVLRPDMMAALQLMEWGLPSYTHT